MKFNFNRRAYTKCLLSPRSKNKMCAQKYLPVCGWNKLFGNFSCRSERLHGGKQQKRLQINVKWEKGLTEKKNMADFVFVFPCYWLVYGMNWGLLFVLFCHQLLFGRWRIVWSGSQCHRGLLIKSFFISIYYSWTKQRASTQRIWFISLSLVNVSITCTER